MKWLGSLLTLLCLTASSPSSPAVAVAAASADIFRVDPRDRKYIRYQSLYVVAKADIPNFLKVHSYVANSLSRAATLKKSETCLVQPDLLRLDLRDYEWPIEVYDKLATVDPYFHMPVIEVKFKEEKSFVWTPWPGGVFSDGKEYPKNAFQYKKEVIKKVPDGTAGTPINVAPFWIDAEKYKLLAKETDSKAPILRADWFLIQVLQNEDRVAGYYAFLGLKKRDDFFKLIGFDEKLAQDGSREVASIIKESGVSRLPRQIFRFGARDFGYWQTRDAFGRSHGKRNALNALDKDFDFQAQRHFGFLPNGLFTYYLSDKNGVQQDTAPPQVGPDTSVTTEAGDAIHIFRGCAICHLEGLRPLKDWSRNTFTKSALAAFDNDPDKAKEKFRRLDQLYLQPMERWYQRDNRDFAQTLVELNGVDWTPAKNATELSKLWDAWENRKVTIELACVELGDGVTPKGLSDQLNLYAKPIADKGKGTPLPPTVLEFKQQPAGTMLRPHFEEAYPFLQAVVRGITFADVVKGKK